MAHKHAYVRHIFHVELSRVHPAFRASILHRMDAEHRWRYITIHDFTYSKTHERHVGISSIAST